jgi:hypothetical protein
MSALSKKYKINSKRSYTIKNKKQREQKSIKVYHNRVKRSSRKRKHYMGGDIEVPPINNIFPSGQSYQPDMDCLEKECDKKDDAGEMTTTCLNTRIVMNLFRQNLDASEEETLVRIDDNFTAEERQYVQEMTEKYITNYVDSLFSRSIFSKNNVDLTPENTQKLKDLLEVIKPDYVVYLTQNSNLSDDIKQLVLAIQEELNAPVLAPAPTIASTTAPTIAPTIATAPIDNAAVEAERAKKAAEDAEAERVRLEAEKKTAEDAEAERLRLDQAKKATLNEVKQINQTRIDAVKQANQMRENAVKEANQIRIEAVEKANQELDTNVKNGMSETRYNFKHKNALKNAESAEKRAIAAAIRAEKNAITKAEKVEKNAIDVIKRKITAKKNVTSSQIPNNP